MTPLEPPGVGREPILLASMPVVGLSMADAVILARFGHEAEDAYLLGGLLGYGLLVFTAFVAIYVALWAAASLLGAALGGRTRWLGRVAFAAVFVAGAFLVDLTMFADALRTTTGRLRLVSLAGSCMLLGTFILWPKVFVQWRRILHWAGAVIITAGVVTVTALFGSSAPPVFAKVLRQPSAATVVMLLNWWAIVWVTSVPFLSRAWQRWGAPGGLLLFVGCVASLSSLAQRTRNVVSETLEGSRAVGRFSQRASSLFGLDARLAAPFPPSLRSPPPERECAYSFPFSKPPCPPQKAPTCRVRSRGALDSLLLISIDSFRADYFGVEMEGLPNFARLRQQSWVFDRAMQTSSGTHMSIFSMHTGRFPMVDTPIQDAWPALARVIGADYIARYQDWDGSLRQTTTSFTDELLSDLRREAKAGRPFLIHVHYLSLHIEDLSGKLQFAATLKALDAELGRVLRMLTEIGYDDRTLVVVTGDHGEEYKTSRGYVGHGFGVWDSSTVTPLILRLPGAAPRHVQQRVSGVDLWPTILEAFHADCDYQMHGRSLFGPVKNEGRPMYASGYTPNPTARSLRFSDIHGVVLDDRKLIEDFDTGAVALYDLEHDPDESRNLADREPEATARLDALLNSYVLGDVKALRIAP